MFNALSPPQNQLYVRLLSERAFTFDRGAASFCFTQYAGIDEANAAVSAPAPRTQGAAAARSTVRESHRRQSPALSKAQNAPDAFRLYNLQFWIFI